MMYEISDSIEQQELQDFLEELNWLQNDEAVQSITIAGAGNMNVVLRVRTNQRSLILKQSRTYVQKYQDIAAPIERIETERDFYSTLSSSSVSQSFPEILNYDASHYLMLMADLGDVEDMTSMYASRRVSHQEVSQLVHILEGIHDAKVADNYPLNMALRELNHQHIFVLPYLDDNGFDLDTIQPGLSALAVSYRSDLRLKSEISQLGQRYLSKGNTLLHGDYYPGSWMRIGEAIKVLDPEFSFVGPKEFDWGILIAHLLMATMDETFVETITTKHVPTSSLPLVNQFMGAEVIRRLIGLAQLPLERTIEEKAWLLEKSRSLIV